MRTMWIVCVVVFFCVVIGCEVNTIRGEMMVEPTCEQCNVLMVESRKENVSSWGSGAAIVEKGRDVILTANHVVQEGSELFLRTENRHDIPCRVIQIVRFEESDVAKLYVEGLPSWVKRWEVKRYALRRNLTAYGFPDAKELEARDGTLRGVQIGGTFYVNNGMSGGPVVQDGYLVGTLQGGLLSSKDGAGGAFSAAIDVVEE